MGAGHANDYAGGMSKHSPTRLSLPVVLVIAVALIFVFLQRRNKDQNPDKTPNPKGPPPVAAGPGEYLFCFWNVENLFDDVDDKRLKVDEPYDNWFAHDPQALALKLNHLTEALLKLNDGRGPDILAVCEVESQRAAEMLRDALNEALPKDAIPYGEVAFKEVKQGRHIAPAVITRLPITGSRGFAPRRVLLVNIEVADRTLTVVASHWTSQLTDTDGEGRDKYADLIHNQYRDIWHSDKKVDLLVCGDFNTTPDDPSVTDNLNATGDRKKVLAGGDPPPLYDLMAGKDPEAYGSHRYSGKMLLYDHICVSPGLLDDEGWTADPDSVRTINTLVRPGSRVKQPWRFGNEKDTSSGRGYSDHFPVTLKLKVR